MDDVYVYLAHLPPGINEFITECPDGGYTVYIEESLAHEEMQRSYIHALEHIKRYDFQKHDVQVIECEAHRKDRNL